MGCSAAVKMCFSQVRYQYSHQGVRSKKIGAGKPAFFAGFLHFYRFFKIAKVLKYQDRVSNFPSSRRN
jgi:hypothetical protein